MPAVSRTGRRTFRLLAACAAPVALVLLPLWAPATLAQKDEKDDK